MNTTDPNTPTLNGEHADFRLDPDNLERRNHVNAYTSRRDLEDDIRGALDPEHWDSDATYDTTVEAVADHFGHWIDYTHGVWEGTDVTGNLAAVNEDDFWPSATSTRTARTENTRPEGDSIMDAITPSRNGEHADFHLDMGRLEARPRTAYTSRDALTADVRAAVEPRWFRNPDDHTAVADAVADRFDPWLDYGRGVWAGTDVAASIAAVDHDDFWDVVAEAIADRLELYAGRACATRPTCEKCTD